ncbi:MAG: D-alanyl-D-alanine carboxypeptidase/D-alanyl-D-alanine-endopeptidase [Chitinophagaceae bacterium]|nr:MAG: D-alanyl-D-alanine carboxypeptidase/D-alanyl-D-alanine-endopeptidase [Chitinophagaceae bacterium]
MSNSINKFAGFLGLMLLVSCSVQKQLERKLHDEVLKDKNLTNAHIGVLVIDAGSQQVLVSHQADKYFVPASNTKIFTCYAALKFLGDSVKGIEYSEGDTAIYLVPSGDPTFLHHDFADQPVVKFLQAAKKPLYIIDANWDDKALGSGWSWDDYSSSYMAERSPMPVYGNIIRWIQERDTSSPATDNVLDQPVFTYSLPDVNWRVKFTPDLKQRNFSVSRDKDANVFTITQGIEIRKEQQVPFITKGLESALELLPDTIGKVIVRLDTSDAGFMASRVKGKVMSRPIDSLLRPMMQNSDNFFAEQILLMVANERFGIMNDNLVTDTLLDVELKDLPQRPRWADGSGLSRFNLFTPADFVSILSKMKNEFGMERIQRIFATGGRGTLLNFYKKDSAFIYAKTGTLSGVVALSGFLYTRKNKLLCFSVLVNNHRGNAVEIRRSVEAYISELRRKY